MVLTIKNFESQNVGPSIVETAPTNLVGVAGTLKATLTWTSATGESGVTWTEEKLVRKEGSAPQGSMDGTVVTTITTKDTYSSTGYEDTGLDSTKTYYYKVFAIYDNGSERGSTDVNVTPDPLPTESIMIKIKADNTGTLKIPVAGYSTTGTQNCPYDWKVSVDGGNDTTYSGTGTNGAITVKTGLVANSEHTVMITPTTEAYGWARAFGFSSSGIHGQLTEVIYDGSYMGYGVSATNTGDYFRKGIYNGAFYLTVIPNSEVLPNTVTTIGNYFRDGEFSSCTRLRTTQIEVLPSNVTTIGTFFRRSQYQQSGVTSAATEVMPNSVTSIGERFRYSQYFNCASLVTATAEVFSNAITSIPNYFRSGQYYGTAITVAPDEVMNDGILTIGDSYRASQYSHCANLITAGIEFLPPSLSSVGHNFRTTQYDACTSLQSCEIYALSTSISRQSRYRFNQFASSGNTTSPKIIKIHGDNVETSTTDVTGQVNCLGFVNNTTQQVLVKNTLVTEYQQSAAWSAIDDNKFGPINPPTP